MSTRREALKLGLAATLLASVSAVAGRSLAAADPLAFDASAFAELTETFTTGSGDHVVTYRFYKAVPYVAKPVDATYQSLNISVPVSIDGKPVDAANAPVLFANSVGGYMPSSVTGAEGVGGGGMTGLPPGGAGGDMPAPPAGAEVASGGNAMLNMGKRVSLGQYALAAGYVVVEPGARGRTLVAADGTYYGVAPAAIVDLKAAVRYLRHNAGRIPGNMDRIVSSGTSAGGALSALLGASGDSDLYASELAAIGAADASDAIFASADWCPITDLENADAAYEWNWGRNPLASGGAPDAAISAELAAAFAANQSALGLTTVDGKPLTAENYVNYLLETFLRPSATAYLTGLSDADRSAYLTDNAWISWTDGEATFTWNDYLAHVGARKKSAPSFDAFDLSTGENNLFGLGTTQARHFTLYSLRHATGDATATLDADIATKLRQMNPMGFITARNAGRARNWWLRVGTKDTDTSLSIVGNLAAAIQQAGDSVNAAMYWDAGHGSNEDPDAFISWIAKISA